MMCLLGSVASQPSVSSKLSADRGFVSSEYLSNLALLTANLSKTVNLVSFFSGELRVRPHQCSFDFVVYVTLWMLPQLVL